MDINRDFKGVWIPKELYLNDNLAWNERILLVEIDSLDQGEGCWAGNDYLGNFIKVSEKRCANMISELRSKGYIIDRKFDGRLRYISVNWDAISRESSFPENGIPDFPKMGEQTSQKREHNNTYSNTIIKEKEIDEDFTLKASHQVADQFSKYYYPNAGSFQMAEAKEKLDLYLSVPEGIAFVRGMAKTKKTDEQIQKYTQKFIVNSFSQQYYKEIRTFPALLTRFSQWLSRDRDEIVSMSIPSEEIDWDAAEKRKNDLAKALKDRGEKPEVYEKLIQINMKKMMLPKLERIKNSKVLSAMGGLTIDEIVRLASIYGLSSHKRVWLDSLLDKIETESWLQRFNKIYDAILKADK